jgi:hypothetical protein
MAFAGMDAYILAHIHTHLWSEIYDLFAERSAVEFYHSRGTQSTALDGRTMYVYILRIVK